ncbi:MAG: hypothetical protein LBJ97_02560 [Mycoplasmataceae bacterium]|jgi:tetrahydromethanopterin S-methyltransferase subunit G|nr:hypothetical protein [Mycoplasmataceae bacterium]
MAKKIVNHVEFANFILEKDRTGEFDTIKRTKVVTDTELLKQIINRLDKIDVRLDNIDIRLDKIETRLTIVESTLVEHGKELKALRTDVNGINSRIDNLVVKNNLRE